MTTKARKAKLETRSQVVSAVLAAGYVDSPFCDATHVAQRLEELTDEFTRGDLVAGLLAVSISVNAGAVVPTKIAQWFANSCGVYLGGRASSLDEALGLRRPGKSNPRRARKESLERKGALGNMLYLHAVGATIDQAAVLVSQLPPKFAESTLRDRYARSGYGATALQLRKELITTRKDIERILSEYPDATLAVKQAKAALRKLYPNL